MVMASQIYTIQQNSDDTSVFGSTFNTNALAVGDDSWAGVRFQNIQADSSSGVVSAVLKITNLFSAQATGSFLVSGHAVQNSSTFTLFDNPKDRVLSRRTVAEVSHLASAVFGENFIDVTPVVLEIFSISGWEKGNNLSLLFENDDIVGDAFSYYDFSQDAGNLAELTLTFFSPVGPPKKSQITSSINTGVV
jgi:hypothetical protein